ncbi:MAG TPA: cupredoxin domain-containing protein [Solirubrobacterales bacterium]|jgi:plastocyanin|nr:cupredoxin domain-containing protein [Solirubrobacterales bacterium]
MKKIAALALALGAVLVTPAAAADSAQTSAAKQVEIVNFAFKPGTLTVSKGATVEFENESNTTHTVTRNGGGFDKRVGAGKAVAIRFQSRGSFAYHCKIHPTMKGKIVVQ